MSRRLSFNSNNASSLSELVEDATYAKGKKIPHTNDLENIAMALTSTGTTVAVFELNGNTVKSSFTSKHRLQSASDNINRSLKRQVTF